MLTLLFRSVAVLMIGSLIADPVFTAGLEPERPAYAHVSATLGLPTLALPVQSGRFQQGNPDGKKGWLWRAAGSVSLSAQSRAHIPRPKKNYRLVRSRRGVDHLPAPRGSESHRS